jgi:hypothetical protein
MSIRLGADFVLRLGHRYCPGLMVRKGKSRSASG